MTRKQIIALFAPGQRVRVTNHYITKTDHPCYGIQDRTIARVNGNSLWFTETGNVEWPNAAQLLASNDGRVVSLFGGGIGQGPNDLFLTLEL